MTNELQKQQPLHLESKFSNLLKFYHDVKRISLEYSKEEIKEFKDSLESHNITKLDEGIKNQPDNNNLKNDKICLTQKLEVLETLMLVNKNEKI